VRRYLDERRCASVSLRYLAIASLQIADDLGMPVEQHDQLDGWAAGLDETPKNLQNEAVDPTNAVSDRVLAPPARNLPRSAPTSADLRHAAAFCSLTLR